MKEKQLKDGLMKEFPAFYLTAVQQREDLIATKGQLVKARGTLQMLERDNKRAARIRMGRIQFVIGGPATASRSDWEKELFVWMKFPRDNIRIGHRHTSKTSAQAMIRRLRKALKYVLS